MIRRQLVSLLLSVVLASALSGSPAVAEAWFEFEESVEVTGRIDLELSLTAGKVFVTQGGTDRLVIEGIKRVWGHQWADAKRVADLIDVEVIQGGSQVAITTNYLPLGKSDKSLLGEKFEDGAAHYGHVDFHITAPAFASISIRAEAAEVELVSVDCDVMVENGFGGFKGESLVGSVTIRQKAGEIQLTSIEGAIDIENGSGSTQGEFLFGPLTVRQGAGEVGLQWVEGDIKIKSVSSSVRIQQMRGAIDLQNDDGDVFVKTELDSPRDFFVQTGSGAIVFSVPQHSAGALEMASASGVIATELPVAVKSMTAHHLVGVFGRGGVRIELSSNSGNVTLAAY
jgi:hypothetical protein